jgi:hypothetical protein
VNITLSQAESLVERNPNFSWDGWTLLHRKQNDFAQYKPSGVFVNRKWYLQKRFTLNDDGTYNVPKALANGI